MPAPQWGSVERERVDRSDRAAIDGASLRNDVNGGSGLGAHDVDMSAATLGPHSCLVVGGRAADRGVEDKHAGVVQRVSRVGSVIGGQVPGPVV